MGEIRKVLPRSGSLQVTIPRRWCRAMGLAKGSFVELLFSESKRSVTITALQEVHLEGTTSRHTASPPDPTA
jgi:bifunctional DNA-binding transcriptional regulator/antitoxin component of YhaV-PrlF toxin-antitoxin module